MPLSRPESNSQRPGPGSPLPLRRIAELCQNPWGLEDYSPLATHNYLLLHVGGEDRGGDEQWSPVAERLRQLPCPVIAVGPVQSAALARGVDVILGSVEEAGELLRNIDKHPLAAMTLVQLLRHNEEATPAQGLFAESLAYASLQASADIKPRAPEGQNYTSEAVLLERRGEELHLALNRPRQRNAYSTEMRDALYAALQLLQTDHSLSRGVIRGEGDCFSIGGDLGEFGTAPDASTAHAVRTSRSVAQLLLELGPRLEFHLHSACIGAGIELPAFGARVLARRNTFIQLPEIKLGLLPGAGGTVSIMRRIGRHHTAWLALSARRISAARALEWGLVDRLA